MPPKKTFKNQKKTPVKQGQEKTSNKQEKALADPTESSGQARGTLPDHHIEKKISVKPTLQTHSSFFIEVFSKKEYGLDIFRYAFEDSQFELFDWKTLKSEMNIFIDEQGNEKRVDLLFQFNSKTLKKGSVSSFFLSIKAIRIQIYSNRF